MQRRSAPVRGIRRDPRSKGAGPIVWVVPVVLTLILAAQLLPVSLSGALLDSALLSVAAVLFLRAGWALGDVTGERQRELGTTSNSYYEPRRRAIAEGGAVVGGLAGAMAWGATTWLLLVSGIRGGSPGAGLAAFQGAVLVGTLSGGVVGAVAGRVTGAIWEHWHRARRRARLAIAGPPAEVSRG